MQAFRRKLRGETTRKKSKKGSEGGEEGTDKGNLTCGLKKKKYK